MRLIHVPLYFGLLSFAGCSISKSKQDPINFSLLLNSSEVVCQEKPFKFFETGQYLINYMWIADKNVGGKSTVPRSLDAVLSLDHDKQRYFSHTLKIPDKNGPTGLSYFVYSAEADILEVPLQLKLCASLGAENLEGELQVGFYRGYDRGY